tara:strand:- start:83142 stop:83960 length:819 start_codon:yes stop_codon:yes gene_type:complete
MKNKFLIFADTRTGSSCLFSIIANSYNKEFYDDENIFEIGLSEPFHPKVISYFYEEKIYNTLYPTEPRYEGEPRKWKDEGRLLKEDKETINYIFDKSFEISHGIKHIWSHLYQEDNFSLLKRAINNNYKIIFLHRNNVVRKCLSHILCEQTDTWIIQERNNPQFEKVDLNRLNRLVKLYVKECAEYQDFLSEYNYYSLAQEDMFMGESYEQKMKVIYDVLKYNEIKEENIPHEICKLKLSPRMEMNPNEILELVPNFKEIKNFAKNEYNEIL